MPDRDAALAAVNDRLAIALVTGDAAGLLTPEAEREARALAVAIDADADVTAAHLLGWYHWLRHLARQDRSDLFEAVGYFMTVYQSSLESVPEPVRRSLQARGQPGGPAAADPGRLTEGAVGFSRSYEQTGRTEFLELAIARFRAAVAADPGGSPNTAVYLNNLGYALYLMAERSGEASVLTEAVAVTRGAVAACPAGDPNRASFLVNLATYLAAQASGTGNTDLLTEAVRVCREGTELTAAGDPNRARTSSPIPRASPGSCR